MPRAPAVVLLIGGAIVISSWSENFGDPTDRSSLPEQLRKASSAIAADPKIALLGAMQSLFEGSMYTFVFLASVTLQRMTEARHSKSSLPLVCVVTSAWGHMLAASSTHSVASHHSHSGRPRSARAASTCRTA